MIKKASVVQLTGDHSPGQVGPDLPAQRRALLLRGHRVGVWHVDSARFGLQEEASLSGWRQNSDLQAQTLTGGGW